MGTSANASKNSSKVAGRVSAGRKLMRREDRRAQILAAAVPVFLQHGFREASLDDIAAQSGITRAIVYRHFESKEALYRTILDEARATIRRRLDADQQVGPESVVRLIDIARDDPDRFRLLFDIARHEPDFADYHRTFADASTQYVRDALPPDYASADVTEFVARLTVQQLFDTILLWLDQDQPTPPEALAEAIRAAATAITRTLART